MKFKAKLLTSFLIVSGFCFGGQSIEDKKLLAKEAQDQSSSMEGYLENLNTELKTLRKELQGKYLQVKDLHAEGADGQKYQDLLQSVNILKVKIQDAEREWRQYSLDEAKKGEESYGFWDQEETTLPQLVMEYGASDYLYVIPPEMLSMKLNMHSSMPVPRESWSELLEIILAQNGIGVKQLNTYARQLYILKQDLIAVSAITSTVEDLQKVPSNSRMIFVFNPPPEQAKSVTYFFERFRDPKRTSIHSSR